MKKLFALLTIAFMALLFTSAVSADTTTSTVTISTSGVLSPIGDAISPANSTTAYVLDKLESYAKALQVPAEHLYKVLVKQQVTQAYMWLTVLILSIIFLLIIGFSINKSTWGDPSYYNNENKDSRYWNGHAWNGYATFIIIFGILFLITFIPTLCNIQKIVTGLSNPEYGAINELLQILK